jgi:hypothetical protein
VPDRHHPQRLTKRKLTKNKVQNSGIFLDAKKRPSNTPRFTSNSPQLHHKNTTQKHPFFPKPPEKTALPPHHKKNAARQKPNRIVNLKSSSLTLQRE